jgi:hypothetical protein
VHCGKIDIDQTMRKSVLFLIFAFGVLPLQAQVRAPGGREFQITKITKNLIATPDYGPGQYRADANQRWLEVEVEFNAAPAVRRLVIACTARVLRGMKTL